MRVRRPVCGCTREDGRSCSRWAINQGGRSYRPVCEPRDKHEMRQCSELGEHNTTRTTALCVFILSPLPWHFPTLRHFAELDISIYVAGSNNKSRVIIFVITITYCYIATNLYFRNVSINNNCDSHTPV